FLAASPTPPKKEPSAEASSPLEGTGRSSPSPSSSLRWKIIAMEPLVANEEGAVGNGAAR
ncbi:hypothetical protein HDU80_007752, partial [Chytriomyces hyalinus]